MTPQYKPHSASFRDPSGFVFEEKGVIYRQINAVYAEEYQKLLSSGLYDTLTKNQWLIPHTDVSDGQAFPKIIRPEPVPFISYPFEWSFSMLKDAALLTLAIQKTALDCGMTLKDASAYNVQFVGSRPIFIDTLSFANYTEGSAWEAYGQFCRHFLAPLTLMSQCDVSLNRLLLAHLDGVPLPLATQLLPLKSLFNMGLYLHLYLHAKAEKKYSTVQATAKPQNLPLQKLQQIIAHLTSVVSNLTWKPAVSEWQNYYETNVSDAYLQAKKTVVADYLTNISPHHVLDMGANDGVFSTLAADFAETVLSFDIDTSCVENNYLSLKKIKNNKITPLFADITNPSPAIGWANQERFSLFQRVKVDTIMALALVHHLAISNNTPLSKIAEFLSQHCQNLIIEFVPKSDDKVQILLQNRVDIFDDYTLDGFKSAFSTYFSIEKEQIIAPTQRILFLMKNKK